MRRRSPVRDWVEYWIARAALGSLAILPRRQAEGLARSYTRVLGLTVPRLRRVALRNLELAFPDMLPRERERIADGVFRSIARMLVSFAHLPRIGRGNIGEWIRYEGLDHFQAAQKRGRGVLFATAHLGNWELSAFAHGLLTAPLSIVVRPLDNPKIDALVARRRTSSGNSLISKKDSARAILGALKRNEAVGILLDQNASLDNGTFVDFFGIPACAGTGFARLAAHSGAAVVPGFAFWSEREKRYILRFYPEVPIEGAVEADTARIHELLERVIREYPDQWLWIHRRWKTRPPGDPSLYG